MCGLMDCLVFDGRQSTEPRYRRRLHRHSRRHHETLHQHRTLLQKLPEPHQRLRRELDTIAYLEGDEVSPGALKPQKQVPPYAKRPMRNLADHTTIETTRITVEPSEGGRRTQRPHHNFTRRHAGSTPRAAADRQHAPPFEGSVLHSPTAPPPGAVGGSPARTTAPSYGRASLRPTPTAGPDRTASPSLSTPPASSPLPLPARPSTAPNSTI